MRISVLLPHYKTWKMSFYSIHQLLKFRGSHQLDIYVVDNNPSDNTAMLLKSFYGDKIRLFPYPSDRIQSHGIAYDWVIPHLRTELFITIESDSFPTEENWLDWYEQLNKQGYDSAGSILELSGGQFVHTAGAFYKKSIWQKTKRYVDNVEYSYLPNIAMKDGFPCHLMVHDSVMDQFALNARNLIQLSAEYEKWGTAELAAFVLQKIEEYRPIGRGVFHNGIGNTDESYFTYAQRNVIIERDNILQDNKKPLIWRMGMEPGQYFGLWMLANKHNVYDIKTKTVWMPNRENQQQERTIMENGFTHLWAVTAYNDATDPALMDIIEYKRNMMEELYNSIPANERI
jgi:hypothetical protein